MDPNPLWRGRHQVQGNMESWVIRLSHGRHLNMRLTPQCRTRRYEAKGATSFSRCRVHWHYVDRSPTQSACRTTNQNLLRFDGVNTNPEVTLNFSSIVICVIIPCALCQVSLMYHISSAPMWLQNFADPPPRLRACVASPLFARLPYFQPLFSHTVPHSFFSYS
jgi:hypothetical protein